MRSEDELVVVVGWKRLVRKTKSKQKHRKHVANTHLVVLVNVDMIVDYMHRMAVALDRLQIHIYRGETVPFVVQHSLKGDGLRKVTQAERAAHKITLSTRKRNKMSSKRLLDCELQKMVQKV